MGDQIVRARALSSLTPEELQALIDDNPNCEALLTLAYFVSTLPKPEEPKPGAKVGPRLPEK